MLFQENVDRCFETAVVDWLRVWTGILFASLKLPTVWVGGKIAIRSRPEFTRHIPLPMIWIYLSPRGGLHQ
jgi:hypothetical protein